MCGEFSVDLGSDGQFTILRMETIKSRKEYICDACFGRIAKGSYHARIPHVFDGRPDAWRFHLQCRNVADDAGWYSSGIVNQFREDDERGDEWVAHQVAVAEWATGLPYKRGK